jgi:hypothetical protein
MRQNVFLEYWTTKNDLNEQHLICTVQGGFDPSNSTLVSSIGTPGAQIGFKPTETALPCLVNTPRPYYFD